jgi:hypothetical protein
MPDLGQRLCIRGHAVPRAHTPFQLSAFLSQPPPPLSAFRFQLFSFQHFSFQFSAFLFQHFSFQFSAFLFSFTC